MDNTALGIDLYDASDFVSVLFSLVLILDDLTDESFEPRLDLRERLIALQFLHNQAHDLSWIKIRNIGAPARTDSLAAIDQTHRNNRHIVFRFDQLPVILDIGQHMVIGLRVNEPRYLIQASEDVSGRCVVFASFVSGTELTIWHQQINIVRANEVLGHADNGLSQGHLAMMVGRMLSNVAT